MRDELLYKYFKNEASSAEVEEIRAWLVSDPSAQEQFDSAHALFNLTEIRRARLEAERKGKKARGVRVFRRIAVAVSSVAAAALVGYVSFDAGKKIQKNELEAVHNVLEVPNGKVVEFALSDGTMVTLNGGSRLEYPVVFSDEKREVEFSGQAKFSVAHDEQCPFVVKTGMCDVTVLGTEFEVMSDALAGEFSASLFSGSVKVTDCRDNSCLYLKPNQMVYMKDNRLQRTNITDDADYLWSEGIISIGNTDFRTLMSKFERSFGVKINILRDTMPEVKFISGKMYVCEGIENALRTLQTGCDFEYTWSQETGIVEIR